MSENDDFGATALEQDEQLGMGMDDDPGLPGMEQEESEAEYEPPQTTSAWDEEIDHEERNKEYAATQPPGGYYDVQGFRATESDKEAEYWVKVNDGFEKVKKPRPVNVYSAIAEREVEGKVWKPRIRLRISPVQAYAKNADGSVNPDKLDSASKLFHRAKLAYEEVLGEPPKTGRQIDEYLRNYPFKVRTWQTPDGSLMVLDLVGVKPA